METKVSELIPSTEELDFIITGTIESAALPVSVDSHNTTSAAKPALLPRETEDERDEYQEDLEKDLGELDHDFDITRKNLQEIITKGTDAVRDAIILAQASDHPRAYEALATLINSMSQANKDLIDLHRSRQKLKEIKRKDRGERTAGAHTHKKSDTDTQVTHQTTNNVIFTGTTKDLLEKIISAKKS